MLVKSKMKICRLERWNQRTLDQILKPEMALYLCTPLKTVSSHITCAVV